MNVTQLKRLVKPGFGTVAALAVVLVSQGRLAAQCGVSCPPYTPPSGPNLLANPDFDFVGPCGTATWWVNGTGSCQPDLTASAGKGWTIHSSNGGAMVRTYMEPSTLPIGGGARMLHILTGGNEGGVWQLLPLGLGKVIATAWVYVRRGHLVMQTNGGTTGPNAWSTKIGEWEQLRICTDGTVPIDMFLVYNQDPNGGDFYVDRVEVKVVN
jgi:hypothetical protein